MRIFHQMRLSKRSRKLGESLDDPSVVEFESLYQREDPWGINKSVPAMARISMIKNLFRFDKFKNSLDIGCGEVFIIGALDFIENITAIDISQIALARAKRKYPEINFLWEDINDLSLIADDQFDFISCFETLYYIDSRSKRKQVLAQIEKKGRDKCVFAFSVVTGGGNKDKYFTYEEALNYFGTQFHVINAIPLTLNENLGIKKIRRKFIEFFDQAKSLDLYLEELKSIDPKNAYQTLFICLKNSKSQVES